MFTEWLVKSGISYLLADAAVVEVETVVAAVEVAGWADGIFVYLGGFSIESG